MSDQWETPKWVMEVFSDWFDPCPLDSNWTYDGLQIPWMNKTFVNPPYSKPMPWIEKAIEENKKGKTIVLLLNVDTSTEWFAKLNEAGGHLLWFAERLKFSEKGTNTRPSMLVVLGGGK